jgi:hypothetical protein
VHQASAINITRHELLLARHYLSDEPWRYPHPQNSLAIAEQSGFAHFVKKSIDPYPFGRHHRTVENNSI